LLNNAAFFAGRAFAAKAIYGTLETSGDGGDWGSIQQQLLDIVIKEWSSPHPEFGARQTIHSGFDTGLKQPLALLRIPSHPRDIITPDEAFAWFNEKFFMVEDYGGKVFVMWLEPDAHEGWEKNLILGYQSQREFTLRFNHLTVDVKSADAKGNV